MKIWNRNAVLLLAFLSFFFVIIQVNAQLNALEAQALVDLREGFPLIEESGYWTGDASQACENWWGVECENLHVTRLSIDSRSTSCYIRPSIAALSELTYLLITCPFSQPAPWNQMQNLTKLTQLFIVGVDALPEFQDTFPTWLHLLPELRIVDFEFINFRGSSYDSLSKATQIESLALYETNLVGEFPPLQNCTNLQALYIDNNHFYGQIPQWLGSLSKLEYLTFVNNQLSGPIPSSIGSLPNLQKLNIGINRLSGPIPSSFSNLKNLTQIYFANNQLDGDMSVLSSSLSPNASCDVSNNSVSLVCPAYFTKCCGTDQYTPGLDNCTAAYGCLCSSNLANLDPAADCSTDGIWAIEGSATNGATLTVGQGDKIVINGSFFQPSNATLQIYANGSQAGSVSASSSAQVGGKLEIIIASPPAHAISLTIINASRIEGKFDKIVITQQSKGRKCYTTKHKEDYTATSLTVLVLEAKEQYCGNDKAKVIGIAVGTGMGVIVIILIAIIVGGVLYRKYRSPPQIKMSTGRSKDLL